MLEPNFGAEISGLSCINRQYLSKKRAVGSVHVGTRRLGCLDGQFACEDTSG